MWQNKMNLLPWLRCGSVDWVPACEPKDRRFSPQSGHMPEFWARYPVGGAQEAPHIDVSPSLTLFKNEKILKKKWTHPHKHFVQGHTGPQQFQEWDWRLEGGGDTLYFIPSVLFESFGLAFPLLGTLSTQTVTVVQRHVNNYIWTLLF